jgi:hypothetical protein
MLREKIQNDSGSGSKDQEVREISNRMLELEIENEDLKLSKT